MYLDNLAVTRALSFRTTPVAPISRAPTVQTRVVVVQSPARSPAAPFVPSVSQIESQFGPQFRSDPYQPESPRVVMVPASEGGEPLLYAEGDEVETDLTSKKGYGIAIAALVILALILLSQRKRN